jgi:dephospho-CoA kinase
MSPSEGHPPVIGLLGGIAAGKTTVAGMFARLGAMVIDADAIGHAVLDTPPTRDRILARWGPDVVGANGRLDRAAIGKRVFGDAQEVAALEAITHPALVAAIRRQIADARRSADVMAIVVDAPLLLEAELDTLCDVLVFVDCPDEVRAARARARGWEADELERRERHQQPLQAKRGRARATLDGNATFETTFHQVQQLWHAMLEP